MKIDVLQALLNYEGKEMKTVDESGKTRPLTVRLIISAALNGTLRVNGGTVPLTAEDKAKIYQLCSKLYSNKEVDFTVEDMAFIKKRAGDVAEITPLMCGKLNELFEKK